MKRGWAPVLWVVFLVAASGAAGAWLGGRFLAPKAETHEAFHEQLFDEIKLTPEQRAAMDALEERHAEEKQQAEERVKAANQVLIDMLERENVYTPEIEAKIYDIHVALFELQKVTIRHLYEMRDLLDTDQRKVFDRHVQAAFSEYNQ